MQQSGSVARCGALNVKPGPPEDFYDRTESDRFVPGTTPTLIVNATIWTGNANETEVISADVLLDKGIIEFFSYGIVDVHSHIGVLSLPTLNGAVDVDSYKGPTQPWLRPLDGLNTHGLSYELAIAGGVTTSLVLPGSEDAIG